MNNKINKDNRTIDWVAFNNDLLCCLKTKDNHKFSRYDAFVWLVEHIRSGRAVFNSSGLRSTKMEYIASYTRLADIWHWSRPTVQKFIEELDSLSVIAKKKNGNAYIFTLNSSTQDKIII